MTLSRAFIISLEDKAGSKYIVLTVNKVHEKTKTKDEPVLLTSMLYDVDSSSVPKTSVVVQKNYSAQLFSESAEPF